MTAKNDRFVSIFGDSISTFEDAVPSQNRIYFDYCDSNQTGVSKPEDTWWYQVINGFDAQLLANGSFSGSMVQGLGFPAANSKGRTEQILGANGEQPDDIFVFIGINDYGWGSAEAQKLGGSEAAPKVDFPDEAQLADLADGPKLAPKDGAKRFGQAYREMLEGLKQASPKSNIWCMTLIPGRLRKSKDNTFCYRLRGIDFDEYNDEIKCAAKATGCNVADICALGYDYETEDGTHPNKEGMAQIAALVLASIGQLEVSELENIFPAYLKSARDCDKDSCIGCEFAQDTGKTWSCVCRRNL